MIKKNLLFTAILSNLAFAGRDGRNLAIIEPPYKVPPPIPLDPIITEDPILNPDVNSGMLDTTFPSSGNNPVVPGLGPSYPPKPIDTYGPVVPPIVPPIVSTPCETVASIVTPIIEPIDIPPPAYGMPKPAYESLPLPLPAPLPAPLPPPTTTQHLPNIAPVGPLPPPCPGDCPHIAPVLPPCPDELVLPVDMPPVPPMPGPYETAAAIDQTITTEIPGDLGLYNEVLESNLPASIYANSAGSSRYHYGIYIAGLAAFSLLTI